MKERERGRLSGIRAGHLNSGSSIFFILFLSGLNAGNVDFGFCCTAKQVYIQVHRFILVYILTYITALDL